MRHLTQEEREDAKRLKKIWLSKQEALHLNQVKAAKELGYNSQGAISQYLNGKVSLNFHAAAKFAKLLRVDIKDIAPRFAPLVEKPTPNGLDDYVAPITDSLGGDPTTLVLDWFAFSKTFAQSLGVEPEHLKIVRLEDGSFEEYQAGTVLLVDDSVHPEPSDGVYLMREADHVVARRVRVHSKGLILSGGAGDEHHMSKDVFGYLRVMAKVLSVIAPV